MNIKINDIVIMKKNHPCGSNQMRILRIGTDFKLKCLGCGHEIITSRTKCEKKIKKICEEVIDA